MDRHRMEGDAPLIRERGFHPEQLTERERAEFAERLREDVELRANDARGQYGGLEMEPRGWS